MPVYEYACSCGWRKEILQPMAESKSTVACTGCGGRALRQVGAPAVHFKDGCGHDGEYNKYGRREK